ncbi:integrase family protein [Acinetobacter higginsii]|uniref:integrase family protein n=1 Tax=Acinetobacter higginsii TaxID=70347 RepID=UPI001F4AB56E|nr:integrase family protein [Acinetobacter higginsii]MCH7381354.1 integrase family protein [Acinetobacter higginsii]
MTSASERTKLTKTFVDSVPLSPGKQVIYRDSELIGFALRVTNTKVYVVERRIGNGKSSVRVTIGKHGEITPTQAREKASQLLGLMSQGINPNTEKQEAKKEMYADYAKADQQPTLLDAYTAYKTERELSDNTLDDYEQCIKDYLVDWRDTKLIDISRKMVQEKHTELTKRSKARANLAMRFFRAVFNFSVEHYLDVNDKNIIDVSNPVNTLKAKKAWNKIKRRKGYIRNNQMKDWLDAVVSTEWVGQQYKNHNAYTNQDFLLTVLLTGFRREEAETIEWTHVDLKYGSITSVDPKNGEPLTLPMGKTLHYIMQQRYDRSGGGKYVFQARQGVGHVTNRSKARLKIAELTGIKFTYHDLRRTFSSVANSLNVGSYTIKRLINHTTDETDVTDGYVQVSFEDLQIAMNMIEDLLLDEEIILNIKNRKFKKITRYMDYLDKSVAENPTEINDSLKALSKVEQLRARLKSGPDDPLNTVK